MRSAAEIAFRLRQECINLLVYWRPPRAPSRLPASLPLPPLPPVRASFSQPEAPVRWRRDPVSGVESPPRYFRRIPYLDIQRAGDHKKIWDRNRHQDLAVLAAQGRIAETRALLDDWIAQNPVHRGMNWTSALEVAFRALSWLYIWQFAPAGTLPASFLDTLYAHGLHLHHNLSVYFSPNTHLLGEAVILHALGRFFEEADWRRRGREWTLSCLRDQVLPDGAYFEQSTYYHVYALDFFLLHHHLEPLPDSGRETLRRMGGFLQALLGEAGELPFLGDDDGGRLYHPFDEPSRFGRESLQLLWSNQDPPPPSSVFPNAGLVFLSNGETQILFDAGPFAKGSAGHSHSDSLSLTARTADGEILIDPGTFTYVADPAWRDLFRSSAMHNTLRAGKLDQALPAGPFRWDRHPEVRLLERSIHQASAECSFHGFLHRRAVRWDDAARILHIEDTVHGPAGKHWIEQFWHFATLEARERLQVDAIPGFALVQRPELSWRSRRFGDKEDAPAFAYQGLSSLPLTLRARIQL